VETLRQRFKARSLDPQEDVFRNQVGDIGTYGVQNMGGKVKLLSKYSLERNNTLSSMFRTQYTPDSL
jgi:hypothetical protein